MFLSFPLISSGFEMYKFDAVVQWLMPLPRSKKVVGLILLV